MVPCAKGFVYMLSSHRMLGVLGGIFILALKVRDLRLNKQKEG